MVIPKTCRAAVFTAPNLPMQLREFELPRELPPGAALCRVRLSTICGSDLHTVSGRRIEPTPTILGHESVGEVVALGKGTQYWSGHPINLGDRVTWTIMASCGECDYCKKNLPQKCRHIRKYGHLSTDVWPSLTGGFAEYIYLFPGTGIFEVPSELDDTVAAPANCALATAVCAVDAIGGIVPGDVVLVVGAGMLGICLAALAKTAGAGKVLIADVNPDRAEMVRRFGADDVISISSDSREATDWISGKSGVEGVDIAFEACGDARGAVMALDTLRIGGRLLVAGLVSPNSNFQLDGNALTRKCMTIRGIHNYHPSHLQGAIEFLVGSGAAYPFGKLVDPVFSLENAQDATDTACGGSAVRVGIRC